jgi:integrase
MGANRPPVKTCSKCGQTKPAPTEHFWADPTKPGGLANPCKDCRKVAYLERRANQPEKLQAYREKSNQPRRKQRAEVRANRPPRQPKVMSPKPPRQIKTAVLPAKITVDWPATTLGRPMQAYVAAQRLSWKRKTLEHLTRLLPAFAAHVGDKWPITYTDLLSFFEASNGNAVTIRSYFARLAGFFNFLEAIDEIDPKDNPARKFKKLKLLPRKVKPAPKAISHEILTTIFDRLDALAETGDLAALRDRAIFRLLYATGMRAGELTRLDVTDLDIPGRSATIRESKSGEYRAVFFDDTAAASLTVYVAALQAAMPDGQVLFPSVSQKTWGSRLKPNAVIQIWRRVAKLAGIETPGTAHGFRHRHALDALEAGISIRALQGQLGHADVKTTANYLNMTDSDRRAAYQKWQGVKGEE